MSQVSDHILTNEKARSRLWRALIVIWAVLVALWRGLVMLSKLGGQPQKPQDPGRRAHWSRRFWFWWRSRTYDRRWKRWYRKVHLRSRYWKRVRTAVLRRDHHTCQVAGCGATKTLDVHHKRYTYVGRELERPEHLNTLITLCRFHHEGVHIQRRAEKGRRNERGVRFPGRRMA